VLAFPLRGQWLVTNPPAHPRFAFDIMAIEASRFMRGDVRQLLRGELGAEDSLSWSRPVLSPVAGVVIVARDGTPDRAALRPVLDMLRTALRGAWPAGPIDALAGNHVVVRCSAGDVLLAHLRRGSIRVAAGESVDAGTFLGAVGNSGNSVAPHLHFQLTAANSRLPWPRVLPFHVSEFEQWRDRRWELVKNAPLPRLARVRVEGP
jgi:murein DD-endopeptidase MepM/ murein hydrolase activator NlpD